MHCKLIEDGSRVRPPYLTAGGLRHLVHEQVTLAGRAGSAVDVAAGYCLGTPVRAEIDARRADLASTGPATT